MIRTNGYVMDRHKGIEEGDTPTGYHPSSSAKGGTAFGYYFNPINQRYIVNRADDLFRVTRFVEDCEAKQQRLWTGLLPSDANDMAQIDAIWKRFKRVARKWGARAIAIIERDSGNEWSGRLHMHLLISFEADFSFESSEYRFFNESVWQAWKKAHESVLASAPKRKRADLEPPRDRKGYQVAAYMAKAFDRSPKRAKFGTQRNQCYIRKLNLKGLWKRDDLPSRTMAPKTVVKWFMTQVGAQSERSAHSGEVPLNPNRKPEVVFDGVLSNG